MSEEAPDILAGLAATERDHGVRILLAVESGSRAWGFPSPDSDFDVRFVYTKPVEFYLQIRERRDVIEHTDGLLDLSGWDARKFLGLMLKSNASAVEWLRSPMVYMERPEATILRDFSAKVSIGGVQRHYYYLARSIWRERFAAGGAVPIKKYFYLIRPALALRYIRHHRQLPPMDLPALLSGSSLDERTSSVIAELVARKAVTREVGGQARLDIIDELCVGEMDAAQALMAPDPPVSEDAYVEADAVFRRLIGLGTDRENSTDFQNA